MDPDKIKKWRRYAIVFGIALAVVCKMVPPDYRAPCEMVAHFCSAGLK